MEKRENTLVIEACDVTGQKRVSVSDLPGESTVGELVEALLREMGMAQADVTGRPVSFHARLEREGRHLHASERVGEVLEMGDRLTLLPNIQAAGNA